MANNRNEHASAHSQCFELGSLEITEHPSFEQQTHSEKRENTRNNMKTHKITYFYNRINGFICRAAQLLLTITNACNIPSKFYLSFNLIILEPLSYQAR